MLFCSSFPGWGRYGNGSQLTLEQFPKYLLISQHRLTLNCNVKSCYSSLFLSSYMWLCFVSFAIKDYLDYILVSCEHFCIWFNSETKRLLFQFCSLSLLSLKGSKTIWPTNIFKACEYHGLTFQGSIYRDTWTLVHPFISSMLTLNVALQREAEATSVWLLDQSINNEAWLILRN